MNHKLLNRFCLAALLEGISFLFLLGIAMPLKYFANAPDYVHYGGWIHGLLFIIYVGLLIQLALKEDWKMKRIALCFFVALIPFTPFFVEMKLKKAMKRQMDGISTSSLQS